MSKRILLQTTIAYTDEDWHIGRFHYLAAHLSSLKDENGYPLYDIVGRNREPNADGNDPILSTLGDRDFDQMWLFALDMGDGLSEADSAGIIRFHQRGGGVLTTRDHNDMGCSLLALGDIGASHYFHTNNPDPDATRHQRDDIYTVRIDYPNYHSGSNGDFQNISSVPGHELLLRPDGTSIEFFPSHPHEGAVGATGAFSQVVATSKSKVSGREFNLLVATERREDGNDNMLGRAIAESSFHHLVDYNWNIHAGCPGFVEEAPGDQFEREPEKLNDIKNYVANAAKWLS